MKQLFGSFSGAKLIRFRVSGRLRRGWWLAALCGALSVQGAEMQALQGHVPSAVKHLTSTGRLANSTQLSLVIALPLRNAMALSNLLQQIYDPASPDYRHYLTRAEFTERFGPTARDYQAVVAFAKANHLVVTATHPNRLLLDVSGTAAAVEKALHVTLETYQDPTANREFYAPDREPALDLSVPVVHIGGLDNYALPRPHVHATRMVSGQSVLGNGGSGPSGAYMGSDFRAAYVPNTVLDGSGQVVGLLEFDGYLPSDIAYYEQAAKLRNVPLQNVLIDGFSGNPSGTGGQVEVSLDIDMAISMATNLSKVMVYETGQGGSWDDMLNRMADDNLARQLSCSWYIPGGTADAVADAIFQQMAAQGQSFFNASGDEDAYTGLISFPGDSPYITQVGGTTLTTSGPGGAWVSETVWNWGVEYDEDGVGSSGGISTQYGIPTWQTNITMASNGGSTTQRNTPDVAMTADNVYVRSDGMNMWVGGTSCAAPLWAGFAALVNQQATRTSQPEIGFINPALAAIGSGANYTTVFHDITTGNNTWSESPTQFYAVQGYDLCTGWGTPAGQSLIDALANPEPLAIQPASGFSAVGGVGGPFSVTSQEYCLTNLGTNTLTWSLSNTSSWLHVSGSGGTLRPGGAAAMVTISLNEVASNLVAGAYCATAWFTNVNDQSGQSREFSLSVIAPPSIVQQPTNQAVLEGAAALFSVQTAGGMPLVYQWQFNGTNLTDGAGLSGSATADLTISPVSAANVGIYTVVVTNFAGTVTSSNVALTIVPSAPVITSQPTNQTVYADVNVQFAVSVVGTSPYSYQWNFNGTNLTGATNATLTLADVQLDQSGDYSVLVSNLYGTTNSAAAVLTVNPPPPCDPVPSGIVAWWRAEDNGLDGVGGNNGTLMNGTTFTNGEVGTAFNLNGINNYVLANPSSLSSLDVGQGGGLTFEGWINPNTTSVQMPIIEYERVLGSWNGVDIGILIYINLPPGSGNGPGSIMADFADTEQAGHLITSVGGLIVPGVWQHIAVTYDKASGMAMIYLNGSVVTQSNLGTFTPQTSFTNLLLGARTFMGSPTAPSDKFSGGMDELSVYNRALSENEIAAIYQAGSEGKCFTPTPPAITAQPTNETVVVGAVAAFSVAASGTPPLNYQWSFNGTNLVGATNATLTLTDVQSDQSGDYSVLVSNLYGATNSAAAVLTVYWLPPAIITQPSNQTVAVDGTATFSVVAVGTPPLSYQWSFNGTNLAGATNATLALTDVQLDQSGDYSVLVSNLYGATNSAEAVLTVYGIPPTIMTQPSSETVVVGGAASFSVAAVGTPPLGYQWNFNGTNLIGATNAMLTLSDVQLGQSGDYSVLVTNTFGSIKSAIAILTVNLPPSCDPAPAGLVAWWAAESNALDSVLGNNGTLKNGTTFTNGEVGMAFNLNGVNNYVLANPSSPSNLNVGLGTGLTFEGWINPNTTGVQMPIFEYERVLGSGNGADVGILFYINLPPSGGNGPGSIMANLVDVNQMPHSVVSEGNLVASGIWQHIALTYDKASGLAVLYLDGVNVFNATIGSFTPQTSFTNLLIGGRTFGGSAAAPSDKFSGLIDEISLYNRALSSNEIAAIYQAGSGGKCPLPPTIYSQPTNQTVNAKGTAKFTVGVVGTPMLKYQWSFNGTNLVTGTNATLTVTNVQLSNAGSYSVLVVNNYGFTNSAGAVLVVQAAPTITSQPTNQTVAAGGSATFCVTASGTSPLSYQWQFNGSNIGGATNSLLVLENVQFADGGYYSVQVTNRFGSVLSTYAGLTVQAPPVITTQPADQTIPVGGTAIFSSVATGSLPMSYQWVFDGPTNLTSGDNDTTLIIFAVQPANAGACALIVSNAFGVTISSNAILTVIDTLDHFNWSTIPSPRFVNAPFSVTIQAVDSVNQVFTNFTGTVSLTAVDGTAVVPSSSGNFVQGVWGGSLTIPQTDSNLVLEADDGTGQTGLANPFNVVMPPALSVARSGGMLFVFWPVEPGGFELNTTTNLVSPQWTPVGGVPIQIGNQYLETFQFDTNNQLYRLQYTLP